MCARVCVLADALWSCSHAPVLLPSGQPRGAEGSETTADGVAGGGQVGGAAGLQPEGSAKTRNLQRVDRAATEDLSEGSSHE